MSGDRWDEAAESPIAMWTALLVLPAAIYVAFWLIDWQSGVLGVLLPIVFCIAVPSLVGSVVAYVARAARGASASRT